MASKSRRLKSANVWKQGYKYPVQPDNQGKFPKAEEAGQEVERSRTAAFSGEAVFNGGGVSGVERDHQIRNQKRRGRGEPEGARVAFHEQQIERGVQGVLDANRRERTTDATQAGSSRDNRAAERAGGRPERLLTPRYSPESEREQRAASRNGRIRGYADTGLRRAGRLRRADQGSLGQAFGLTNTSMPTDIELAQADVQAAERTPQTHSGIWNPGTNAGNPLVESIMASSKNYRRKSAKRLALAHQLHQEGTAATNKAVQTAKFAARDSFVKTVEEGDPATRLVNSVTNLREAQAGKRIRPEDVRGHLHQTRVSEQMAAALANANAAGKRGLSAAQRRQISEEAGSSITDQDIAEHINNPDSKPFTMTVGGKQVSFKGGRHMPQFGTRVMDRREVEKTLVSWQANVGRDPKKKPVTTADVSGYARQTGRPGGGEGTIGMSQTEAERGLFNAVKTPEWEQVREAVGAFADVRGATSRAKGARRSAVSRHNRRHRDAATLQREFDALTPSQQADAGDRPATPGTLGAGALRPIPAPRVPVPRGSRTLDATGSSSRTEAFSNDYVHPVTGETYTVTGERPISRPIVNNGRRITGKFDKEAAETATPLRPRKTLGERSKRVRTHNKGDRSRADALIRRANGDA
jgi:hypothetical protein